VAGIDIGINWTWLWIFALAGSCTSSGKPSRLQTDGITLQLFGAVAKIAGHSLVRKQAFAASASGHSPMCFVPSSLRVNP
jgi:hypothetical protein